ncbi:conserved exported protein of unknown function [Nitrospira sp. KM1]|uniref:hypothetical protein n=1 Tax=Nitrospira sp. KM1 TaxID=1936990 RepID=UPI0013A7263D|nr:hypothetical protein [Nitrospira sp. KM1]BCA57042.1 conserved exported protein of unknown function [Nitrospira sp. KM1]
MRCFLSFCASTSLILITLNGLLGALPLAGAEPKVPAQLHVRDALTSPGRPVVIEAALAVETSGTEHPAAGEVLELIQEGRPLASAQTDSAGRAVFQYTPKVRGSVSLLVRTSETSRLSAEAATTVAAWEHRAPLLAVEWSAMIADPAEQTPFPVAADELGKLSQFYFNLIYVVTEQEAAGMPFTADSRARRWLASHKFPAGYVLVLPPIDTALGTKIDELRSEGWTTLKIGIGRSRKFAEAFLQRRLEAVMVPEPPPGEAPKKAKVAKEWIDVRKKL